MLIWSAEYCYLSIWHNQHKDDTVSEIPSSTLTLLTSNHSVICKQFKSVETKSYTAPYPTPICLLIFCQTLS